MIKKNVLVGLGEIGKPILQLISKSTLSVGYDINQKLIDRKKLELYTHNQTSFLHICIPFTKNFKKNVLALYKQFEPEIIVIHSTVSPGTTKKLQEQSSIPIIYSPTRGVHTRMLNDLKRYTKFFGLEANNEKAKWASLEFSKLMKKCGVKTKKMSNPITLELAKIIVDTTYYGWLINYAQLSKMITIKYKVDYDEMWSFSEEIHKFLGNRPKMYPGFIGGHCVIPNLDLIENQTLDLIKKLNTAYYKKVKNAKTIHKKYSK